jgi:Raf kinase inhibitor-like YbhB/YbcL family protein
MALQVKSPAFTDGQTIPTRYTCDGENISPPLEWSGQPKDTKSVAVICDDPDAPSGTFTHWVLYNVPSDTHRLSEGSPGTGVEGRNSFEQTGFGGPCPPSKDRAHRYIFRVYALDVESLGRPGMSQEDVEGAMRGHILAKGQLMGRYQRASTH